MDRMRMILMAVAGTVLAAACGGDGPSGDADDSPPASTSTVAPAAEPTGSVEARSLWPHDPAQLDPQQPARWTVEIVETYDHDPGAFTQGLESLADGTVLESTGLRGSSTMRIVDLETGTVVTSADLAPEEFGEGATRVGDTIVQLTWQEGIARRWRIPDLSPLDPFTYAGEGWGLCAAGDRIAMTDGTSELTWRDAGTFVVLETVDVRVREQPVIGLNELECIDGFVIANIWLTDQLVVIRDDGAVVATIDAGELVALTAAAEPDGDVLNGVADLGDGTLLLGGKRWPVLYRVRLVAR